MLDYEGTRHFKQMSKDFIWGTVAGVAMTLSCHPFDSTKVRMQTSPYPITFTKWVSNILRREGVTSFYRGLTPPLFTIPFVNAVLMSSYEFSKRVLGVVSEEEFTFAQSLASGIFAGFVNSFVVSPVELVKWRLQVQTEPEIDAYYKGSIDWVIKIIQEEGLRVLFTSGLISTIFRDSLGFGSHFAAYYLTKRGFAKIEGCNVSDLGYASLFLSGGIGGLFGWLLSYPLDTIKTKLQTQPVGVIRYPSHPWIPDEGIISCARSIIRTESYYGFWKGFSACSFRAFWGDAFMFLTYETALIKINHLIE